MYEQLRLNLDGEVSVAEPAASMQYSTEQRTWLTNILGEHYSGSEVILDSFVKADSVINNPKYTKIICTVSGGKDSTIMMDLLWRIDRDKKIDYVWINTGLEYQAIKDHLKYLESRYGVEIKRMGAVKPVPLAISYAGQPFLTKRDSDMIHRLQINNFDWSDDTFENHIKRFPNCKNALMWFDNQWNGGPKSSFNISRHRLLREFLIENPPWFKISNKCCEYAKKKSIHKIYNDGGYDLNCYGTRAAEGGVRATAYSGCFTEKSYSGAAEYRPLHWYSDDDIAEYERMFDIKQSEAYTKYQLRRTGCACCSFGRDFEFELQVAEKYEPKLYKAVCNIFGDSYKYTRMYHEYREKHKQA